MGLDYRESMEIISATQEHIEWIIRHRLEMLRDMGWTQEELDNTEPLVREYLKNFWKNEILCFLAVENNQIIGGCAVSMNHILPSYQSPTGRHGYIHNLYVEPEYRRRGIATRLLDHAIGQCIKRGVSKVWLHATDIGLSIYIDSGFEKSDNFYGLSLLLKTPDTSRQLSEELKDD